MPTSLSRLRIAGEPDQARDLLAVLAAVAGTAPPDCTVTVAGTGIEVVPCSPAPTVELELITDRDLTDVLADVVGAIGSAATTPSDPDAPVETVTAHIGDAVTVTVRSRTAPNEFDLDGNPATEDELRAFVAGRMASAPRPGTDYVFWRRNLIDVDQIRATVDLATAQLRALIPPGPRGLSSHIAVRLGVARLAAEIEAELEEAGREQ